MAHGRRVTFESSSSSESDSSSASSRKTSPTSLVETAAPSTEPLNGKKRKRESSGNDNDNKTKSSKRSRSQKEDNEEPSFPGRAQDPGEIQFGEVQHVVITAIRATDLTLGLRRTPAGFLVVFEADGAEYQTSNESVHIDQAVVEWHEHILLPCEPSLKVRVSVYASFELGPMLCHGELLRTFKISVGELLDRSEKSHPISFQPKQGEVVSPCTSLLMTLEQRLSDGNDAAVLFPLTTLASRDTDALALKTDAGHRLLARYRRTQDSRDLDQSIKHFGRTLDLCPMDQFYRPAALFNLATIKYISCQADGRHLDLGIAINLFQDALELHPTDHPDRAITQLHLAIAILSRFAKRGFQMDADAAKELSREVLDVCHANSQIYRAASIAMESSVPHSAGSIDTNNLRQERPAASMLPLSPNRLAYLAEWCLRRNDHTNWSKSLSNLASGLSTRFDHRGNAEDLCQAIALHKEALASRPVGHTDRSSSLDNLAVLLSIRFFHRGNTEDLDQAIALHKEALALHPVGHTDRSKSLNNLANRLSTRFDHRGNAEDLDQAIALHRDWNGVVEEIWKIEGFSRFLLPPCSQIL